MPTDQNDPHRRIDNLQHQFNMLETTTKADLQTAKSERETAKAESASSHERLLAAIADLRTDTWKMFVAAVVVLGVLITVLDRYPPSAPVIINPSAYQPPAASVLPDPN